MNIIRLNSGTLHNPTLIDKKFGINDYIIIESGFYILSGSVIINELMGSSQVKEMWGSSQVNVMRGSSQVNVMWESSQVNVMWESSQVNVMRGSSQVKEMWGSSQVNVMRGSSQVNVMWESSQVKEMRESSQVNVMRESSQVNVMRGSSQVNVMRESSQVKEMRESSQVNVMWESSQVNVMRGSSQVKEMWGSSLICNIQGNNKIVCFGYNTLFVAAKNTGAKIELNKTSRKIILPDIQGNFDVYSKRHPVKIISKEAILYKAVHKINGKFIADKDKTTEYIIGVKTKTIVNTSTEESCAAGLHISHLKWAVDFGKNWVDMAIIECKTKIANIIVAKDCDGKVRTSELTTLREVPKSEYEQYL